MLIDIITWAALAKVAYEIAGALACWSSPWWSRALVGQEPYDWDKWDTVEMVGLAVIAVALIGAVA